MIRTYIPRSPLSSFVAMLWLQEPTAVGHARERVLPTGTVELVIDLGDAPARVFDGQRLDVCREFRGPVVCGAHAESFAIDAPGRTTIVGVHFRPGGAFPFLGMPADELCNVHVDLEALWGGAAHVLRDRLREHTSADTMFAILEAALLARLRQPVSRHPAVEWALHQFRAADPLPVGAVQQQIGLSRRHFSQLFRQQVGLTPKLFCRVQRFQSVLRHIDCAPEIDWADVALACGYFDQAHFIHDFRAFSGLTPGAYLIHRSEHLNHVPLES